MAKLSAKAFWLLPKTQRKILVAKDILKWIEKGVIKPSEGRYFAPTRTRGLDMSSEVRGNLSSLPPCEVCELGAAALCIGNLGNKMTFEDVGGVGNWDYDNLSKSQKLLFKVFTKKEVALMEACIENGYAFVAEHTKTYQLSYEEKEVSKAFYSLFTKSKDRMIAISKNIIRNKGKFIPEKDIK